MKRKIQGTSKTIELPEQFKEEIRQDIIKKAVIASQSKKLTPYGTNLLAGLRKSSFLSKRRRKYRGTYGRGKSRTPSKVMWRRGMQFGYEGATAPMTKGGRVAHPPETRKIIVKKINKKERLFAIRSALSACAKKEIVTRRGHKYDGETPLIINDSFESLSKTKEVKEALLKLGLEKELERCSEKKIRAGKGKMRGRKYKKKIGPLIVVSKSCKLSKAGRNIPGVQVRSVNRLSAELLAPGTMPGRLCLFTESAIKELKEKKLYLEENKKLEKKEEKQEKKAETKEKKIKKGEKK